MNIIEARPDLYLIILEQLIKGAENAIGSWLFDGKYKFLVDVGPKASARKLTESLGVLKIKGLDFIFLTHIHLDHAGAVGTLIKEFPNTKVVCHESGVKHLIDPQKLWERSKKILGEIALKYGEMDPVEEGNILSSSEFKQEGFNLIETPGHAIHHLSMVFDKYLFAGEAAGVFRNFDSQVYLRPATPPNFILDEAVGSLDRLLKFDGCEICYAHVGMHRDATDMLRRYKDQLFLWRDVIAEQLKHLKGKEEELIDRCMTALIKEDKLLEGLKNFKEDEKEVEFFCIRNSIRGFLGYLRSSS
jgi:glyoxylase-like metal-dependent hydrolase (beta-lactamase superfamily II)